MAGYDEINEYNPSLVLRKRFYVLRVFSEPITRGSLGEGCKHQVDPDFLSEKNLPDGTKIPKA